VELYTRVSIPLDRRVTGLMMNRLLSHVGMPLSTIETVCNHYAPIGNPDRITSSHALDILAHIWAGRPEAMDAAVNALDLLAKKYDPIRTNYWNYRKLLLQKAVST
jgi:protein farnesyltransferase/geranylgeranyltransferase type-1 subunit alpha